MYEKNEACDGEPARLTGVENYVFVALVHGAGADEELRAHPLDFLHLTLAVVVIVQGHSVQLVSRVVAEGVKGHVGIRLPPYKARNKDKKPMKCLHALDEG